MQHNRSLAQSHAFDLALMVPVVLFTSGNEFRVLPADEIDGDEVEIMYEYDPHDGRPVHRAETPSCPRSRFDGCLRHCPA